MMAAVLLTLTILLAAAGLTGLIAVTQYWEQVKDGYSQSYTKFGIAAARAASAIAALCAKLLDPTDINENAANIAAVIGAVAYFLWESAQCTAEYRINESLAKLRRDLWSEKLAGEQLDRQITIRAALNAYIRQLVNEKKARLSRALVSGADDRRKQLWLSLDPEEQMLRTLALVPIALRSLHPDPSSEDAFNVNFRVALYVPVDGHMVPLMGYDLSNGRYDPFTSYGQHRDRFSIDNRANPSHTVRCVLEKRTLIVPDTVASGIEFFTEEQRNYLKSLLAHPIPGMRLKDGSVIDAALVVDANHAGYFREADRQIIEFVLNEFAVRLVLESQLIALSRSEGRANG